MHCTRLIRGGFIAALLTLAGTIAAQAATVTLSVVNAADNSAVGDYKYIINVDNTGTNEQRSAQAGTGCNYEDDGYPLSCNWASIHGWPTSSPIYTQGDQSDFASGLAGVPPGRYLISVLAAGYKLDGRHFKVNANNTITWDGVDATNLAGVVRLRQPPLPDGQIQAAVFEDISSANGTPDPTESGMAGFHGHINDVLGEVTTNVYGDPLCSEYVRDTNGNLIRDTDGNVILIPGSGGQCVSKCYIVDAGIDKGEADPIDAAGRCPLDMAGAGNFTLYPGMVLGASPAIEGKLKIPNLGPNRYSLFITPPDGSGWIQTTTLEGSHDFDAWVIEGATGLDTEFIVGGEPFPAIIFGYASTPGTPSHPGDFDLVGTGAIKGLVEAVKVYVPGVGGVGPLPGTGLGCCVGITLDKPIARPWLALADLNNGDATIWVGQGNANGTFDIPNVPAGDYQLTWWDEPQNYALDTVNVTVGLGENVDLGLLPMTGWWTFFDGYVFNDLDRDGIKDAGEPPLVGYALTLRSRNNTLMDRGSTTAVTDASGYYKFDMAYPTMNFLVMEAYDDIHYSTGITYQADNQPTPTTDLGAGVDVSVLSLIGLSGRLDWGKHTYNPSGGNGIDPRNGGIVGSLSYDTTRNELDPQYQATEDWQPGVPGLTVKLWAPVECGATGPCDASETYALAPDGSFAKGHLLNTYVSEMWERPTGCVARNANGDPLVAGTDQAVLPLDADAECLEGPIAGIQFGPNASDQGTPAANFGVNVDGNYGFGDGCFNGNIPDDTDPANPDCVGGTFEPLGAGDYLVEVVIPNDAKGRPMYKVTKEEDINIANGDEFTPAVPPPACAGPLHTVDLADFGDDIYPPVDLGNGITVPASTPVENATMAADLGGTPYEGTQRPLCNVKLVELANGKSVVPMFHLFTDVPIPTRFFGLLVDDLNFTSNRQSILYGEKLGIQFAPVGIYDYTNRLVTTSESDYNGMFDVLLPSTNRISCPTPSGVCGNLYRFVGNDPGVPGRLNLNYNAQYRTISADFEAIPGQLIPADMAPTQVGVATEGIFGNITTIQPVACALDATTPQLYAVSKPYVNGSGSFTITGLGFGSGGQVMLDSTVLTTNTWSDTLINVTVPVGTAAGPRQLKITRSDNGQSTVNGLTFHVLDSGGFAAFPAGGTLDNFNRSTAGTSQTLGSNWGGAASLLAPLFRITPSTPASEQNQAQVRSLGGTIYWSAGSALSANQDAYFTFTKTVASGSSRNGGVLLKVTTSGGGLVLNSFISATYNATAGSVVVATATSIAQTLAPVTRATFSPVSFANGDQLGARALADGTVNVYKNATLIGTTNVSAFGFSGGGRIGVRFAGSGTGPFNASNDVRFDNFGGGNVAVLAATYNPTVLEVGPGKTYDPAESLPLFADHAIQRALDAAPAGALVVVYPNEPSLDPRQNPRGAYYENLIISKRVKLQGVGPGSPNPVSSNQRGSIIDGSAFAGDGPVFDDWYTRIGALTWSGNQTVYDGAVISLFLPNNGTNAFPTAFSANTAPSIDGFDLRGGNQQGFPANIDPITGLPTGQPGGLTTQGGAIFANAYARNLQITNNVVQNNGGAYGTVRIGTPDLAAPDTDNQNDNVVIARNRIIANAGTNLAGGIGLFNGADNYAVRQNDVCGNFSAEYGGGISAYGRSPGGAINDNRIYFNRSYDEGGGIMIAGELPIDPNANYGTPDGPQGSGAVNIYNNLIQANLGNDDGGGIRFLMAGNFPMNVYNNFIVNNVSTHEGGGISLDDAPNVRIYNNTFMRNLTTDTAVTSLANTPAPAGLATTANSVQLQATLPGGSPTFSNPLLFNNVFWDNRAGTRTGGAVVGLGNPDDPTPIDNWDLGVVGAGAGALLAPTNSIVQQDASIHPYTTSASNSTADPIVVAPHDVTVSFDVWRGNPAFIGAILVAVDLPPNLMGDYHLSACGASPACNLGAASKTGVSAPTFDIDNQARPQSGGFDAGADEVGGGGVVVLPLPSLTLRDNFNRANNARLGVNWSQPPAASGTVIRVLNNHANCAGGGNCSPGGQAIWTNGAAFGTKQGAAFTYKSMSGSGAAYLYLKASGGTDSAPAQFIRVGYASGQTVVQTTTNGGSSFTTLSFTIPTSVTFAAGDILTAVANADGSVDVWKTAAANVTTYVGHSAADAAFSGVGGRIGMGMTATSNVDNFRGGNVP